MLDSASQALLGQAPQIGPLFNNGGPTKTHLPFTDSIVLDQVPVGIQGCGLSISTDQRGEPRPQADACDIGAVEGSGPFFLPQTQAVPAMNSWGVSLIAALLGLIGSFSLRRRRRSQS
ncbi:MAG: choice-of-anchor Q domain-containing protein [Pseudomonadota bacterium]